VKDKYAPPGVGELANEGLGAIGEGLRQLWSGVENEPVPDFFLDLLDAIDAGRQDLSGQPWNDHAGHNDCVGLLK